MLVSDVAAGKKFHLPSGAPAVGTSTYDADTSAAAVVLLSEDEVTLSVDLDLRMRMVHKTHERIKILKESGATRVVLEYNGMWTIQDLFENLPVEWAVYQAMCFVDSNTFLNYNQNMRSLVVDKINVSELVVFNRFDTQKMDNVEFHKIVRGVSRRTQIAYETTDGQVAYDDIQDPLPFDITKDAFEVDDQDYALFYRDIMEEPDKYNGKTVTFRGAAARDPKFPKGVFAVGRHVMTCCVEDIQYCWLVAEWDKAEMMENRQWIKVTGKISIQRHKLYKGKGPVLKIESVTLTSAPEQEVATFY